MAFNGFKWIVQQTQNGTNPVKPWNLSAYKAAGFKTGVWGVHYANGDIEDDSMRLLSTAGGADLLVMNIEHRFTVTEAQQMVEKLKIFTGPKALICLVGDLVAMKSTLAVLLAADWDIIGETYTNDQTPLNALEAEWQAKNAGIPRDRFSHALGMYFGLQGWYTGAQYAADLSVANAGRRFSAWMVEQGAETSYSELRAAALRSNVPPIVTIPPPPSQYSAGVARADCVAVVNKWKKEHTSSETARLEIIQRIAATTNVDAKWNRIKYDANRLLKSVGL